MKRATRIVVVVVFFLLLVINCGLLITDDGFGIMQKRQLGMKHTFMDISEKDSSGLGGMAAAMQLRQIYKGTILGYSKGKGLMLLRFF